MEGLKILKLFFLLPFFFLLVQGSIWGKKHKDDGDDYDDFSLECYADKKEGSRNCLPGCYCGAESECRPYFYPGTPGNMKHKQCTNYHYPKWRIHKKDSKDGKNTTILILPHFHPKSEVTSVTARILAKNNFTTVDELAVQLLEETQKLKREQNQTERTLEPLIINVNEEVPKMPGDSDSPASSKSFRFLRKLQP